MFRAPSLRQRFVRRARTLKQDRQFLAALGEARQSWNTRYPAFALDAPGDWTQPPPFRLKVLPPRLSDTLDHYNLRPRAAPVRAADAALYDQMFEAQMDWQRLVQSMCLAWWPPEYYPIWSGDCYMHPAECFLSACLVWRPSGVPEDWIQNSPIRIRYFNYDPAFPDRDPAVNAERAQYEAAMTYLLRYVEAGEPITRETFRAAAYHGWRAKGEAYRAASLPTEQMWNYPYVVLPPGLTSTDWQALETDALIAAAHLLDLPPRRNISVEVLRAHARQLKQEGLSQPRIAHLLGISHDAVKRALSSS